MNNQVLSIAQMQELIELGIDTSKASWCWCKVKALNKEGFDWMLLPEHLDKCDEEHMPTFTLQDILEILPPVLGTCTDLEIKFAFGKISYKHPLSCEDTIKFEWDENNIIEAAFNMLIYLKKK